MHDMLREGFSFGLGLGLSFGCIGGLVTGAMHYFVLRGLQAFFMRPQKKLLH